MESTPIDAGEVGRVFEGASAIPRVRDVLELTKARLNALVLLTAFIGFYMGRNPAHAPFLFLAALIGTFMMALGSGALNQWMERVLDARMERTAGRPLPAGRMSPRVAAFIGAGLCLAGAAILALLVNPLTALLGAVTVLIYLALYTPMKTRSIWNTVVGAVAGALPPVMGWTAATETLSLEAWCLFGILFLWQLPHFFALAWRYRWEYREVGFRMLPDIDPRGGWTALAMVLSAGLLVPAVVGLFWIGAAGRLLLVGGLILGVAYTLGALGFLARRSDKAAMRAFLASLLYLPLLIGLIVLDPLFF